MLKVLHSLLRCFDDLVAMFLSITEFIPWGNQCLQANVQQAQGKITLWVSLFCLVLGQQEHKKGNGSILFDGSEIFNEKPSKALAPKGRGHFLASWCPLSILDSLAAQIYNTWKWVQWTTPRACTYAWLIFLVLVFKFVNTFWGLRSDLQQNWT